MFKMCFCMYLRAMQNRNCIQFLHNKRRGGNTYTSTSASHITTPTDTIGMHDGGTVVLLCCSRWSTETKSKGTPKTRSTRRNSSIRHPTDTTSTRHSSSKQYHLPHSSSTNTIKSAYLPSFFCAGYINRTTKRVLVGYYVHFNFSPHQRRKAHNRSDSAGHLWCGLYATCSSYLCTLSSLLLSQRLSHRVLQQYFSRLKLFVGRDVTNVYNNKQ